MTATAIATKTIAQMGIIQYEFLHLFEQHHILPSSHSKEESQEIPTHPEAFVQCLKPVFPQHIGARGVLQSSFVVHDVVNVL